MITVVHVITRLELGGAQENTLYTCQHLDRTRHRVILLRGPGGLLDDEAHASPLLLVVEVPELIREIDPRTDVAALRKLRMLLADLLFEHRRLGHPPSHFIVHTHSSKAGILGRLAARAARVPRVVHTIHGFGFHEGQDWRKRAMFVSAERLAGRLTDAFIGVSQASLDEARRLGIIRRHQRAELIRSGMRLEPFLEAPSRAEARARLRLLGSGELIVTIANFKPQKDPLTLIEAFRRLAARRPGVRLLYAGDGELRHAVEAAVREFGLSDRVTLLGWRRDVPLLIAAADVIALSSIFEGLPRAAVQAVATGRPFVGTQVDGTPEVIRDGVNGYLVPPRDADALAAALERALELRPVDPQDRVRVRAWDADEMVRAQEALYADLLGIERSSNRASPSATQAPNVNAGGD